MHQSLRVCLRIAALLALCVIGGLPVVAQTKKKASAQTKATAAKRKPQTATKKGTAAPTNQQINTLKKEQRDLNQRIATNEKQLKQTQQQVRTQLQTLEQINGNIAKQDAVVKQVTAEVATVSRQVLTLDEQRAQLQQELKAIKLRYQRSLLYMARHRTALNKLLFIFSAQDFSQMYRRMKYMTLYARYQQAQGEMVRRKEEELFGVQQRLQQTQQVKQSLLQQEQSAQNVLKQQHTERQQVVASLQQQQKTLQTLLEADRKKYAQLNSRIDQLVAEQIAAAERARKAAEAARKKQEAEERAAAARAAAQAAKAAKAKTAASARGTTKAKGKSVTASAAATPAAPAPKAAPATSKVYAANDADVKLSSNFAANKGNLPVPITGSYRITSHFGANTVEGLSGVTLDNKGVNYTTSGPAQARAVFDGEVSAVFSIGGQMNVLVRHGSYISVYCNLSSVSVRQGQQVKTRQTIGTVSSDGNGGYTLHFQLRKETTKLNPSGWVR